MSARIRDKRTPRFANIKPWRHGAIVMLVSLTMTGGSHAQGDRPIKFILPVATASGVDTITRAAQPALSKALGAPVVIENQPGAGGIVGTQALVKSSPDGTTLSIGSNNHVIYPSVYKSVPFDAVADITPIAVVGSTPIVLTNFVSNLGQLYSYNSTNYITNSFNLVSKGTNVTFNVTTNYAYQAITPATTRNAMVPTFRNVLR